MHFVIFAVTSITLFAITSHCLFAVTSQYPLMSHCSSNRLSHQCTHYQLGMTPFREQMSLTSYLWRRHLRASTRVLSALIQLDPAQTTSHQLHFQFHPTRGKKSYKKKLIECLTTEIQHEKDNYETDTVSTHRSTNKQTSIILRSLKKVHLMASPCWR